MVDDFNPVFIEQIIENALMNAAVKFFENDINQTIRSISQGRRDVCMYFSQAISEQIAEHISQKHKQIKAVYDFELDPSAIRVLEDASLAGGTFDTNLIVWVESNKEKITESMHGLKGIIETTLGNLLPKGLDAPRADFRFAITVVNDHDIRDRKGKMVDGVFVKENDLQEDVDWANRTPEDVR